MYLHFYYLILELYSRDVVGWMIRTNESAGLAKHLFTRALVADAIGREPAVAAVRQRALTEHSTRHPDRYVKGAPTVALPPTAVHINPDLAVTAYQLLDPPGGLRRVPTPVDTSLPEVVTSKSHALVLGNC